MVDVLLKDTVVQAAPQQIRRKHVGNFLYHVPGPRMAFHLHDQAAQALDPAPHCRARYADFLRDLRAADEINGCVGMKLRLGRIAAGGVGGWWARGLGGWWA